MKSFLMGLLGLSFCVFTACQSSTSYTLTGTLKGLDSGWAVLRYMTPGSDQPVTDSARIVNGRFTFTGTEAEPIHGHLGVKGMDMSDPVTLYIDPGTTSLSASADSLTSAKISGGSTETDYQAFQADSKVFDDKEKVLDSIYNVAGPAGNKAVMDSLNVAAEAVEKSRKAYLTQYIRSHSSSFVSAYQIEDMYSYNPEVPAFDSAFNGLDPKIKSSGIGKAIAAMLAIARRTDVGQPAPDFTLNDTAGHAITLSEVAKGKVVLLDFWASWCGPCRQENPNVVKAFREYSAKGFTVLGVSLDDKKEPWLKAINDDQLTWTQVSDLKGWACSAAATYGIRGIPMNFLLGKDGKIIAKGLRGEVLDKKLATLLQ